MDGSKIPHRNYRPNEIILQKTTRIQSPNKASLYVYTLYIYIYIYIYIQ